MKSSKCCSHIIDDEVELKTNDLLKVRKASKADKQKGRSPQYCKSTRECCFQLNTQSLFFLYRMRSRDFWRGRAGQINWGITNSSSVFH